MLLDKELGYSVFLQFIPEHLLGLGPRVFLPITNVILEELVTFRAKQSFCCPTYLLHLLKHIGLFTNSFPHIPQLFCVFSHFLLVSKPLYKRR